MRRKNFLSALSSIGAVSLTVLMMLLNASGTYFFYESFANSGTTKEASLFNPDESYREDGAAAANTEVANISDVKLIPLGSTFGIKLYTDGVIVTSLADINIGKDMLCPAKDSGIQVGDYIVAVNGTEVESNNHFTELLSEAISGDITLTIKRENETFDTLLKPVFDGKVFRCGMWIRDSAAGIGTLTFADPESGKFAGLGHGICDVDTKQLMALRGGEPAGITVCDIIKGEKSSPGKINGYFGDEGALGVLYDNNDSGIYGKLNTLPAGEAIPLASKTEVATGPAQVLVTVDNDGPRLFSAEIESIASDPDKATKNLVVKITDTELLAITGGIVQGMSGTPIIQNGKLIGAITHVFIDDPQRGYGIFAETMYRNCQETG